MLKNIKRIYSIISTILVIVVVIAAFLLAGVRLIGLKPFTVLSGSMEPKYHVGSIIYVGDISPEDVKVGDPLTYRMKNGTVVTHEVIEIIEADDPDDRQFITKGLANKDPDGAPVAASNIIGKPLFSIPYLGYVSNFVQHPPGTYIAICFILAVLLLSFIPDLLSSGKNNGTKPEPSGKETEPSDNKE